MHPLKRVLYQTGPVVGTHAFFDYARSKLSKKCCDYDDADLKKIRLRLLTGVEDNMFGRYGTHVRMNSWIAEAAAKST